jgi:hypothetical protein
MRIERRARLGARRVVSASDDVIAAGPLFQHDMACSLAESAHFRVERDVLFAG